MPNHLFIINPVAGSGSYKKFENALYALEREQKDIFVEKTEFKGHCRELLKKYRDKNIKRIYSLGGDGSFNELLNAVMKENLSDIVSLGILPCGSGNDYIKNFSRYYDVSKIREPLEYINQMIYSDIMKVDIGKINEEYFCNVLSLGFDAEVIKNSHWFKKNVFIPKKLSYLFSAIYTLIDMKKYDSEIVRDGGREYKNFMMLSIGKGKFYGSGMKVLPNADIRDGFLDMCIVEPINRRRVFALMKKFIEGKHQFLKEVSMSKVRKINIRSQKSIPCQFDGELYYGEEFKIEVIPQAVNLIKPI